VSNAEKALEKDGPKVMTAAEFNKIEEEKKLAS